MDAASLLTGALGIRLTLWLGKAVAVPAPPFIVEALSEARVTLTEGERDGFQLTFTVGRAGIGIIDHLLVASPLLRPFNRVILQVWFGVFPEVLMDGFITRQELTADSEPGGSTLTITGEDLRVLMDLRETSLSYPNLTPELRVQTILAKYMAYLGLPPATIPAKVPDLSLVTDRIPGQTCTDLQYIQRLAKATGYVFYVEPQAPMVNLAYWGPDKHHPLPQSALSVGMGPNSNVDSMRFSYDALKPAMVIGAVQDKRTSIPLPVVSLPMSRPPMTLLPAIVAQQPDVRMLLAHGSNSLDPAQVLAKAQAATDKANDAVYAEGELDAVRYGHLLRPRRTVGVRGAGLSNDGQYQVAEVTHTIKKGEYRQSFKLVRDGMGPLVPLVLP